MEKNSDSDWESSEEDQYNESDTSVEIPDPNMSAERLYQEVDKLPERLEKTHFQEGMILYCDIVSKKETSYACHDSRTTSRMF